MNRIKFGLISIVLTFAAALVAALAYQVGGSPRKLLGEKAEELCGAPCGEERISDCENSDDEIWGWCASEEQKPKRKLCGGENEAYARSEACARSEENETVLCGAKEIFDMLTPELIELYEREIAGEKILSGMSKSRLEKTAQKFGISISKTKAIILLQDFAARTNKNVSISELAAMNEFKIIGYVKTCADDYLAGLPENRQQELKDMLKNALAL